ncbi:hypothetical protein FRB94_014579 [Tulasnella sp. JGI-2019a]|nr:hypothetical protein FRB94_014579 [Tulasnella sp. JGI-2019a]KAG9031745.1 hypothetical protein FRB95_002350 [Tulasnella sp. JGI-2019a]
MYSYKYWHGFGRVSTNSILSNYIQQSSCQLSQQPYPKDSMAVATTYQPRPARGATFMAQTFGIPLPPKAELNMEDYRANSLNQPPRFRDALRTGVVLLGTGLSLPTVQAAKITATLGFDWAFIDAEHTPMGPDLMTDLIKTINYYSEGATAAVVRVPTHGHEWITWALDAGAAGIILPHTETAEQARHAVSAARFSPIGNRSFPPFPQAYGFTDGTPEGSSLLDVYNNNAAIIMQIESDIGAKNAEEIAAVPGIDGIMVGTADLRLSMRLPLGFGGPEPEFIAAVDAIETAAKRHNLALVAFALGPVLEARARKGYTGLMIAADVLALVAGQTGGLAAGRGVVKQLKDEQKEKKGVTSQDF